MNQSIIIHNLTAEDLKVIIADAIELKIGEHFPQQNEQTKYLTRYETAELLRISLPTLHQLTKKGIVRGLRIGARVLYSRDQIESSLKEISTKKYRRAEQ